MCLCPVKPAMPTNCRIVLLMHPHEYGKRKSNTGLLTCLNLENSEYIVSVDLDNHPRVRQLVENPENYCVLLYPGPGAVDISAETFTAACFSDFEATRQNLVVILLDATWSLAGKLLRDNPRLLELPQLKLTPAAPSRYRIKRQPKPYCLSTIETVHEILVALDRAGLESYQNRERLLETFTAMQDNQLRHIDACANPRFHGKGKR